jgi:hypothetical protein
VDIDRQGFTGFSLLLYPHFLPIHAFHEKIVSLCILMSNDDDTRIQTRNVIK